MLVKKLLYFSVNYYKSVLIYDTKKTFNKLFSWDEDMLCVCLAVGICLSEISFHVL